MANVYQYYRSIGILYKDGRENLEIAVKQASNFMAGLFLYLFA